MADFDGATIPISPSLTQGTEAPGLSSPKKARPWWIPSRSLIAFVCISLAAIGGGAKYFLSPPSAVVEEESIADMEGFESAPPFVGKTINKNSNTDVGVAALTEITTNWDLDSNTHSTDESATADVWFIGTIEAAEPTERLELPRRLSGEPNESSVLR